MSAQLANVCQDPMTVMTGMPMEVPVPQNVSLPQMASQSDHAARCKLAWWEKCSQQCMQGTPSHREFRSNVAAKVNPCMLELQEAQERGEASREAKRRCRAKQGREKGKGEGEGATTHPQPWITSGTRSPCHPNRDVPSDANQPTVQQLGVTRKGQSM